MERYQGKNIDLGAGLIGIGRRWGFKETEVPSDTESQAFLQFALDSGIRYFDTAPSYGKSEERLGHFVRSLSDEVNKTLIIATKFGEHWDTQSEQPYTDHSFSALCESIDQSLKRLTRIDILQVHKTSPEVLKSADLHNAINYAKERGVKRFGASINDMESASIIAKMEELSIVQLPFNQTNQDLKEAIRILSSQGKTIVINRPFNMGSMLFAEAPQVSDEERMARMFKFIIDALPQEGVILTGTKSIKHLSENIHAFKRALTI